MGDRLRSGIPSLAVTRQLGQLSLASLRGRLIEYQLRLGWRREYHLCRVADNTVWSHMAREFPYSGEVSCELLYSVYLYLYLLPYTRLHQVRPIKHMSTYFHYSCECIQVVCTWMQSLMFWDHNSTTRGQTISLGCQMFYCSFFNQKCHI